jgi:hypothetical protein
MGWPLQKAINNFLKSLALVITQTCLTNTTLLLAYLYVSSHFPFLFKCDEPIIGIYKLPKACIAMNIKYLRRKGKHVVFTEWH